MGSSTRCRSFGDRPHSVPQPERRYYWFGDPIATESIQATQDDDSVVESVDQTKRAVEAGLEFLLANEIGTPNRSVAKRLLVRAPVKQGTLHPTDAEALDSRWPRTPTRPGFAAGGDAPQVIFVTASFALPSTARSGT